MENQKIRSDLNLNFIGQENKNDTSITIILGVSLKSFIENLWLKFQVNRT